MGRAGSWRSGCIAGGPQRCRHLARLLGIVATLAMLGVHGCLDGIGHTGHRSIGAEFESLGRGVGEDGWPRRILHQPSGLVLVLIPPGHFSMGSPRSEAQRERDEVQREVSIESPFYLGETEVTVDAWRRTLGELPNPDRERDHPVLPVTSVSWPEAQRFIAHLNQGGVGGWRLPREAEWEYACRAGTTTAFSFGDAVTTELANFNARQPYAGGTRGRPSDGPVPVRSLPANPWGLYEMHGNVWEWVEDLYVMHPERGDVAKDFPGASRVMRGGAWTSWGKHLRCANRDGYPPNASRGPKYGFRVALAPR